MEYTVTVHGSFETNVVVEAESIGKAKAAAAERLLSDFPSPTLYRIDMISAPADEKDFDNS